MIAAPIQAFAYRTLPQSSTPERPPIGL